MKQYLLIYICRYLLLLDNINNKVNIDIISIAEFLKKGFIYHPNTFYTEIKTLDNGSYCILDFNEKKIIKKKYFKVSAKPIYNFNYLVNYNYKLFYCKVFITVDYVL